MNVQEHPLMCGIRDRVLSDRITKWEVELGETAAQQLLAESMCRAKLEEIETWTVYGAKIWLNPNAPPDRCYTNPARN